jgi:hypothetical protein
LKEQSHLYQSRSICKAFLEEKSAAITISRIILPTSMEDDVVWFIRQNAVDKRRSTVHLEAFSVHLFAIILRECIAICFIYHCCVEPMLYHPADVTSAVSLPTDVLHDRSVVVFLWHLTG